MWEDVRTSRELLNNGTDRVRPKTSLTSADVRGAECGFDLFYARMFPCNRTSRDRVHPPESVGTRERTGACVSDDGNGANRLHFYGEELERRNGLLGCRGKLGRHLGQLQGVSNEFYGLDRRELYAKRVRPTSSIVHLHRGQASATLCFSSQQCVAIFSGSAGWK